MTSGPGQQSAIIMEAIERMSGHQGGQGSSGHPTLTPTPTPTSTYDGRGSKRMGLGSRQNSGFDGKETSHGEYSLDMVYGRLVYVQMFHHSSPLLPCHSSGPDVHHGCIS